MIEINDDLIKKYYDDNNRSYVEQQKRTIDDKTIILEFIIVFQGGNLITSMGGNLKLSTSAWIEQDSVILCFSSVTHII